MPRIYKQTSRLRPKGAKDLHTNLSFKIEKVQRISIQTCHLRFKGCKGFTCKLIIEDSKGAKDLLTNYSFKIQKRKGFTYKLGI